MKEFIKQYLIIHCGMTEGAAEHLSNDIITFSNNTPKDTDTRKNIINSLRILWGLN